MHLGLEIASFLFLGVAVISGLVTLWRHTSKFYEFRCWDLLPLTFRKSGSHAEMSAKRQLRVQGIMYVLLTSSTCFCIFDIIARSAWLSERGWADSPLQWKVAFLFVHVGIGGGFTAMHTLFDVLLSDDEYCALCRRRIERVGNKQPS